MLDIVSFFKDVVYDKKNGTYVVKNRRGKFSSVSSVIDNIVPFFDKEALAQQVASERGLPLSVVLEDWNNRSKDNKKTGEKVHLFIKNYHKDAVPTNGYEEAFVEFLFNLPKHIKIIGNEVVMYHDSLKIIGTVDMIGYNKKTGKFILYDFKTTEGMFKTHLEEFLLEPFSFMYNCYYSKYVLQMNLYQLLIEQTGVEVEDRIIIELRKNGKYSYYKAKDLSTKVIDYLIELKNKQ